MNSAIILNEEAGQGKTLAERLLPLQDDKFSFDLFTIKSGNLDEILKRVSSENYSVLAAAGGDGTVSTVAATAVKLDRTLGIIPAGTLNHFAKDTGIPLNIEEAVSVLKSGITALIDTGEINGRIFLNNSSIGLYPKVVKKREKTDEIRRK